MSILFHVSPRRNLSSIYRVGVSPAFAAGARAECWFCSASKKAWAVEHVAERHGVPVSEVVVLRVNVRRSLLTRRGRGVWTCARVVRSVISVALPFAA